MLNEVQVPVKKAKETSERELAVIEEMENSKGLRSSST
jgi:hypothetical protein